MYTLKAEHRDTNIKAKKLRRVGITPSCIYGNSLDESIPIQIPERDVRRLLRTNSKGSTLMIELGETKYNVMLKEFDNNQIMNQIEHIEFQHLVADEAINTVTQVVLINRDKNANLIQQFVEEIPYNALPMHFVESVVIDLDGLEVGTTIKIEDLDIFKNEDIKLLMEADIAVLSIADNTKVRATEEDEEGEGEDSEGEEAAEE